MLSCNEIFFATAHFAVRSSATTSAAIRKWKLRVDRVVIRVDSNLNRKDRKGSRKASPFPQSFLPSPADLFQDRAAAFTHRGIDSVLAHVDGIVPAALTFLAVCLVHLDTDPAGAVS